MRAARRRFVSGAAASLSAPLLLPSLVGCAADRRDDYVAAADRLREPLSGDPELADLVRYATLAANGHNTQPWRFASRPNGVSVVPDFSRRTPVVDPDDHHLFVSLGCATENLLIAAAACGRAGAAQARSGAQGVDIDWTPVDPLEDGLFAAIPRRQSTRSIYEGRAVPNGMLRELEAAARVDGVEILLITAARRREQLLEFVLRGNGQQMDDPAFVAELLHWIRFAPAEAIAAGDGLYAASSGNPTLPAWLGRRLFPMVFRKDAENDKYAGQIRSSSGVAVFIGKTADPDHWMRVGRSFQRFALRATALGLRHAHVNQPVEVATVRRDFARWLGIGDVRPDLVVRFGHAAALPMSLRRPIGMVIAS